MITATRLIVDLEPGRAGCEITLFLHGFDPNHDPTQPDPDATVLGIDHGRPRVLTPAARRARDRVAEWIAEAKCGPGRRHRVFLPRPQLVHGWTSTIRPGSTHAGYLFLHSQPESLNARIADERLVPVDPALLRTAA